MTNKSEETWAIQRQQKTGRADTRWHPSANCAFLFSLGARHDGCQQGNNLPIDRHPAVAAVQHGPHQPLFK